METSIIFMYAVPVAILIVGLYLSIWTDILKDVSTNSIKPYSFANTQLMWWTLIIVCTFSYAYGCHMEVPKLTSSCLILLGISLGTTTAAKIIDKRDTEKGLLRHQNLNADKNFFGNIL